MARNTACSVYIGNLDEKVSERVLYEILIQVGRVVDLHIPRDKETNRHKGFAFAEYETEEIADYAVKLFSGLVRLHNKTLKFGMSGQDKTTPNSGTPLTPKTNSPAIVNGHHPLHAQHIESPRGFLPAIATNLRVPTGTPPSVPPVYPQVSGDGLVGRGISNGNFEYSRRLFGAMLNSVNRPDGRSRVVYPSY